jgi:hypothetical protein
MGVIGVVCVVYVVCMVRETEEDLLREKKYTVNTPKSKALTMRRSGSLIIEIIDIDGNGDANDVSDA